MFLFLNLFPVKMCMETEIRTFIPSDILSESWALDDFASWWRNVGVVSPSVGGFSSESKLAQPNWPCFQGSFYMFVMFKHCGISSFMRILIMWSIWCSYKRFSLIQSQWRSGCTLTVWARWTPQQAWRWLKQGLRLEPCFFFFFQRYDTGFYIHLCSFQNTCGSRVLPCGIQRASMTHECFSHNPYSRQEKESVKASVSGVFESHT